MKRICWLILLAITLSGLWLSHRPTTPAVIVPSAPYSGTGQQAIYIVSHGWHTGIVVPTETVYHYLPTLQERFGEVAYLEFGWGDKGFYQSQNITVATTLAAIFLPTNSVMHVVGVPFDAETFFANSQIEKRCINDREQQQLMRFIASSFATDSQQQLLTLRQGIYGDSQFYAGNGQYYAFNTCNKWTAKALKSIGMDLSVSFKLTASSIINYLVAQRGKMPHYLNCQ